jgi:effector-binding domain-containing protein
MGKQQMNYQIATHHREPQAIVSIRERHKKDDLPGFLKAAFPKLLGRLNDLGVGPSGAPFVIYHEFGSEGIDAEVSVPIRVPIAATGKIVSRVLPAMTVAQTLHLGPYEKLGDAYTALWHWIRSQGFRVAGPVQERYLNGPGDRVGSNEYRTEIEMPVVPLVVAAPV